MHLTNEELDAISNWQPIKPGFGRDDAQTAVRIKSIADRINSACDLLCEQLDDDGLSNYFVLFSFIAAHAPDYSQNHKVDGLLIYLSACAPVGVIGRSQKCAGPWFSSHDSLQIEDLLPPNSPEGHLEEVSFAAIRSVGYNLLSADDVSQILPPGVKPYEYCYSPEPWDRVFHALFANTD